MAIDGVQRTNPGSASTGSSSIGGLACIARGLFSCWRARAQPAEPLAGFTAAAPQSRHQVSNAGWPVLERVGYDFAREEAYRDAMYANPLDESMTYPLDLVVWHSPPAQEEEEIELSDDVELASFGGDIPVQGRVAASVEMPGAMFTQFDARLNTLRNPSERASGFWTPKVQREVHARLEVGSEGALHRMTNRVLATIREQFLLHWTDYCDKEGVRQAESRRDRCARQLKQSRQGIDRPKVQAEMARAEEYLATSRAAAMKSFEVKPLIRAALYDAFTDACATGNLTNPTLLGYLRQLREKLASVPGAREAAQTVVADAVLKCGLSVALQQVKDVYPEDRWACDAMEGFLIDFSQTLKQSPAQAVPAADAATSDLMHLIDMLGPD